VSASSQARAPEPRAIHCTPETSHHVEAGSRVESAAVAVERTLVLVKPDAMQRGLGGEILRRFEARGLAIRAARLVQVEIALAEEHYAEHAAKPFFGELVEFITSAPTLAFVLEGEGAIVVVRMTMGATDPARAAPGTIRGDLALSMPDNLVHGSDSPESAAREIALWFGNELV
jgi:nucleoside-diphosphate kinase